MLSETKLNNKEQCSIEEGLSNWKIVGRYDIKDSRKHMGLLLLISKRSKLGGKVKIKYESWKRNEDFQIEGLTVEHENGLSIGYIYCCVSPSEDA